MSNENYITYGEEWKKKMSKLSKSAIIEIAAKIGQDKERLEDAIESLGYGRNGLGS